MHIATVILVGIALPLAAICGWLLASARAPIDLPHDYASDDDPYLVASVKSVLTAQPDPLSGIEHETMGV